jgi:hypothetical protein
MLRGGIIHDVYSLVDEWAPRRHNSELAYRKDLFEFLGTRVKHHALQKEAGGSRADIGIGSQVAIELKFDFNSAKVDKLFGETARHLNSFSEGVILVFCGHTDNAALSRLRSMLQTSMRRSELLYPAGVILYIIK